MSLADDSSRMMMVVLLYFFLSLLIESSISIQGCGYANSTADGITKEYAVVRFAIDHAQQSLGLLSAKRLCCLEPCLVRWVLPVPLATRRVIVGSAPKGPGSN
jgi:hypothetical protein